jgi:ClpP class serine protease
MVSFKSSLNVKMTPEDEEITKEHLRMIHRQFIKDIEKQRGSKITLVGTARLTRTKL